MKPHKHAELIKQWADGHQIECRHIESNLWVPASEPSWFHDFEYRIKPEEKKPVVRWLWADKNGFVTQNLYSEDEWKHNVDKYETLKYHTIKLEWSRTEFPE